MLLANDSDPDGDPLSIVSVQDAVNASVSLTDSGNIRFQGAAYGQTQHLAPPDGVGAHRDGHRHADDAAI